MQRRSMDSTTASAPSSALDLRGLGRGMLWAIACFVLCLPLLFSVNPLPLALVCAAEGGVGWLLVGTLIGIWQQYPGVGGWYAGAVLCGVGLRLCLRWRTEPGGLGGAFQAGLVQTKALLRGEKIPTKQQVSIRATEPISRRVIVSMFAALIPALGIPISRGFVFYDLYGAVFYLVLTPPLTALFAFSFPFESKYTSAFCAPSRARMGRVSEAIILAAVCFCGRNLRFGDVLIVAVFALFICLEITRRRGLGAGAVVAVVCGLAFDPLLIPLLLGIILIYSLLRDVIGSFSLLIASMGGAIYLFVLLDGAALWSMLASLAAGVILFSARCRLAERVSLAGQKEAPAAAPSTSPTSSQLTVALANQKHITDRISSLSAAFSSLAETFRSSENSRFSTMENHHLQTPKPAIFGHRGPSEQFAAYFDGISHLFRDVLKGVKESEEGYHKELSQQISNYLREKKMTARWCVVSGRDQLWVRICGLSPATLAGSIEQFRRDIGKILGREVSKLHYEVGEEYVICLHTLPCWQVSFRHQSLPAPSSVPQKNAPCGDTVRTFETADGIFYALLCDGMGHGQDAAITSTICAMFLERTLRAGAGIATALGILNHYLLTRAQDPEGEISSTVDLFRFDRFTGRGELIKCGAAPSLLFRNGTLTHLCAHTLPIGILSGVDAQVIPLELCEGDVLMLMSDGVHDGEESTEDHIRRIVEGSKEESDATIIRAVLEDTRARGGVDDASILFIRIGQIEN